MSLSLSLLTLPSFFLFSLIYQNLKRKDGGRRLTSRSIGLLSSTPEPLSKWLGISYILSRSLDPG